MLSSKGCSETEDQSRLRFQVELEFVQCLANPNYVHFLAQRGYLKEASFVNYVKYLLYWKEPEYARYLKYPMCLYFLDLLQHEHFRREAVNAQCCKFIDDQAILLWQHYTRRRNRIFTVNGNGNGLAPANADAAASHSDDSASAIENVPAVASLPPDASAPDHPQDAQDSDGQKL